MEHYGITTFALYPSPAVRFAKVVVGTLSNHSDRIPRDPIPRGKVVPKARDRKPFWCRLFLSNDEIGPALSSMLNQTVPDP
jgi:hypothetical protein